MHREIKDVALSDRHLGVASKVVEAARERVRQWDIVVGQQGNERGVYCLDRSNKPAEESAIGGEAENFTRRPASRAERGSFRFVARIGDDDLVLDPLSPQETHQGTAELRTVTGWYDDGQR
jgi:hypothetical protein